MSNTVVVKIYRGVLLRIAFLCVWTWILGSKSLKIHGTPIKPPEDKQ